MGALLAYKPQDASVISFLAPVSRILKADMKYENQFWT